MQSGRVFAHSKNALGVRQELRDHPEAVADLARSHASAFGSEELATTTGLWHDLGLYHPDFQQYLLEAASGQRAPGTGPDHKGAGTTLAAEQCEPLAFLIAGHHGGLMNAARLKEHRRLWKTDERTKAARQCAPPDLLAPTGDLELPPFVKTARDADHFIRMLFSALVDADFLDTERHFQFDRAEARDVALDLSTLWERFSTFHDSLHRGDDHVAGVRAAVYQACLDAADLPSGVFRLTVPTGGGKALSAMAFAM